MESASARPMSEKKDLRPGAQETLQQVTELLRKQQLVEGLVRRQEGPRQELVENLARAQRLVVWDLVKTDREGEILLEVSDAVRETLIAHMDEDELVAATGQLDTDEIADLAPDLPREVIQDVFQSLGPAERDQLRAAMSYEEGTVGALMDFDMISIREDVTLDVVLGNLRRLEEMPDHTDQLFVVDRAGQLRGAVPVNR